jgi:hypothetical protein
MEKWVPCGEEFITGDVIRWEEAIWKPKTSKKQKSLRIGSRKIVAEVEKCDQDGWVQLVVKSSAAEVLDGWIVAKLDPVIRRRRGPIGQGLAERLLWSDESARALVASRFMGAEPDAPEPGHSGGPRVGPLSRVPGAPAAQRRGGRFRKKGPKPRP